MGYDLIIQNGRVLEGSGTPSFPADIGITNGRIIAIGKLSGPSARAIDAAGMIVSPGFIDIHTHSDYSFHLDPLADSKLRQGVTLEVVGNCGFSFCGPLHGEAGTVLHDRLKGYGATLEPTWTTFPEWLDRLGEIPSTVNIATQIGHGNVRAAVLGFADRAPTNEELKQMKGIVGEALDAGALGFSSGLFYAPGSYAKTDELIELSREASTRGKFYSSHIRDEGNYSVGLFHAFQEAIEIGRQSGAKVQISHNKCGGPSVWGKASRLLEMIEAAREDGIDVAGDQYPYTAGSTALSAVLFPRWAQVGGKETLLANLRSRSFVGRLASEIRDNFQRRGGPERIMIAMFPPDRQLEGKNLVEIADIQGTNPVETGINLFREYDPSVVVDFMEDGDVDLIASHPWVAVGSDGTSLRSSGPLSAGRPHPRSYGCFPRFLAHYQRTKKLISFEDAVRKMTYLPATRIGLTHRGRIAPDFWADLVVFDPDKIRDTATYEDPHQYADGIHHVIVNGVTAVLNGLPTGATAGKVIDGHDR